jgi:hypothetical protein
LILGQTVRSLHLASAGVTYNYALGTKGKAFLAEHPDLARVSFTVPLSAK